MLARDCKDPENTYFTVANQTVYDLIMASTDYDLYIGDSLVTLKSHLLVAALPAS